MTIRAYRVDTNELVWLEVVRKPGVLAVPGLKHQLGVPVRVEVTYGEDNGS